MLLPMRSGPDEAGRPGSSPSSVLPPRQALQRSSATASAGRGPWSRAPLTLQVCSATAQARIALLDTGGSAGGAIPVTLGATAAAGLHADGLLQVLALGEVRTEVTVDQPAGLTRLETSTEHGTLRARERYESSARLALRRAIEARSSGQPGTELAELLEDMSLTRALLAAKGVPAADV
jgi:hypothetical protein